MSEYQYYEWLCLDRPLTHEEQREVDKLSSHITVTSTGAWVDYSWGDFKHDPKQVLADYFDAFLYMANWGSKELMFRFPQDVLDPRPLEAYLREPYISLEKVDDAYILAFQLDDEEPEGWVEAEGRLGVLASLRADILHDDYRALYIVWRHAIELNDGEVYEPDELYDADLVEEAIDETPVPPGLDKLNPALQALMEFFAIDPSLVAAAAAKSDSGVALETEADLAAAIRKLPREEADSFLLRLCQNEPHLSVVLRRRLKEFI
jgi:hypothetical protein